jgi:hypothetical protein
MGGQSVRVALCFILAALSILPGCGGFSPAQTGGVQSPAASPEPVMRIAKPGETFALRSGLRVTAPHDFVCDYIEDQAASGVIDGLMPRSKTDAASFETVAASSEHGGQFVWPLVAASADGTVEVRHVANKKAGTAGGLALTSVIIRLPGHPTAVVILSQSGKHATADPRVVMAQLEAAWRQYQVQGVSLPKLEQ